MRIVYHVVPAMASQQAGSFMNRPVAALYAARVSKLLEMGCFKTIHSITNLSRLSIQVSPSKMDDHLKLSYKHQK